MQTYVTDGSHRVPACCEPNCVLFVKTCPAEELECRFKIRFRSWDARGGVRRLRIFSAGSERHFVPTAEIHTHSGPKGNEVSHLCLSVLMKDELRPQLVLQGNRASNVLV